MVKVDPHKKTENELIKTFIIGKKFMEEILEELKPGNSTLSNQSTIVTGVNGIGKSHFLNMTALRIKRDNVLNQSYLPIVFPQELPNVGGLFDLLKDGIKRVLALISGGMVTLTCDIEHIKNEFSSICAAGHKYFMLKEKNQFIEIEGNLFALLEKISKAIGKKIVFLLENLQYLFGEKFSSKERKRFISHMQNNPGTLLIIGSALTGPGLHDYYGKAMGRFFKFRRLTGLNRDEVRLFLEMVGNWRRYPMIKNRINKFCGEIEVFRIITGGNPGLFLHLYDILEENKMVVIDDILGKIVEFIPYFQSETEKLSVSKQMVIDALCVDAPSHTPSEIAGYLHEPIGIVNENLKRLSQDNWVTIKPEKGLDRKNSEPLYSIADYFYRLWYQIHQSVYLDTNVKWMMEIVRLVLKYPELRGKHYVEIFKAEEVQPPELKVLVFLTDYISHTDKSRINLEGFMDFVSVRYQTSVDLPGFFPALIETLTNAESRAARVWSVDPLFREVVNIFKSKMK